MSERGRSSLFGRPGALLVEETAPRIAMPSPPMRVRAPDLESFDPVVDAPDDDGTPAVGPLQVFVGASPAEDARRAKDTSPGMLMTDAIDQLGDAFGRTPPARPRLERTEIPEPRVGPSARPAAPGRPVAGAAPVASSPPLVRQRSQGIPTAAARTRVPTLRVEAPPNPFADDENTNVEIMPFDALEPTRGGTDRREITGPRTPPWDEPRARKPDPAETSFPGNARIPPRSSTFEGRTGEPTNPGDLLSPFGEISSPRASGGRPVSLPPNASAVSPAIAPVPTPAPSVAPLPSNPPPTIALLTRPPPVPPLRRSLLRLRPSRRQVVVMAALVVLLAAGAGALRWERSHPGAFAQVRDRITAQAAPSVTTGASSLAGEVGGAAPVVGAGLSEAQAPVGAPVEPDEPTVAEPTPVEAAPVEPIEPVEAAPAVPVAAAVPTFTPVSKAPESKAPVSKTPASAPTSTVPTSSASALGERRGSFQAATGFLQVICNRKATIYVDDVKRGSTADAEAIELTAGTHRVKVVANGRSRTMDVRIDAGRPRQVQFELR